MPNENFSEFIICDICCEAFNRSNKRPRVLSCGHSFCHSCLAELCAFRPRCPKCKALFYYHEPELIPINFTLEDVISRKIYMGTKLSSRGYCETHDSFKELRCTDCDIWVCGVCCSIHHKFCKTLLVREFNTLKEQLYKKVEKELHDWELMKEKLTPIYNALKAKRIRLMALIKKMENKLKTCGKEILEIECQEEIGNLFCAQLRHLLPSFKTLSSDGEFSKAAKELDILLRQRKREAELATKKKDVKEERKLEREIIQSLLKEENFLIQDERDRDHHMRTLSIDRTNFLFNLRASDIKLILGFMTPTDLLNNNSSMMENHFFHNLAPIFDKECKNIFISEMQVASKAVLVNGRNLQKSESREAQHTLTHNRSHLPHPLLSINQDVQKNLDESLTKLCKSEQLKFMKCRREDIFQHLEDKNADTTGKQGDNSIKNMPTLLPCDALGLKVMEYPEEMSSGTKFDSPMEICTNNLQRIHLELIDGLKLANMKHNKITATSKTKMCIEGNDWWKHSEETIRKKLENKRLSETDETKKSMEIENGKERRQTESKKENEPNEIVIQMEAPKNHKLTDRNKIKKHFENENKIHTSTNENMIHSLTNENKKYNKISLAKVIKKHWANTKRKSSRKKYMASKRENRRQADPINKKTDPISLGKKIKLFQKTRNTNDYDAIYLSYKYDAYGEAESNDSMTTSRMNTDIDTNKNRHKRWQLDNESSTLIRPRRAHIRPRAAHFRTYVTTQNREQIMPIQLREPNRTPDFRTLFDISFEIILSYFLFIGLLYFFYIVSILIQ